MTAVALVAGHVLRYHPHVSGGSGLLDSFLHAIVWSLGWHAGASIARLLGAWLIVIAAVAGVVYLARRVRSRTRRTRRSGRRRSGRR